MEKGCCNMNIYHTLGGQYLIHGREFPINTVVLILDKWCRVVLL